MRFKIGFLYLFIVFATVSQAIDIKTLEKKHKEALKSYQKNKNSSMAISLLKSHGVEDILGEKPKNMSTNSYVNILNDYGFFLYKLQKYDKALSYYRQVLLVEPERNITYLNSADLYKKQFEKSNNKMYLVNALEYYKLYKEKIYPKKLSLNAQNFLDEYKDMKPITLPSQTLFSAMQSMESIEVSTFLDFTKEEGDKLCSSFLKDAKANQNIEIIKPSLIVHDLFDPRLRKKFSHASEEFVNSFGYQSCNPGHAIDEYGNFKHNSPIDYYPKNMKEFEEWREEGCLSSYISQCNIRLYDVDIDNDIHNGNGHFLSMEGIDTFAESYLLNNDLTKTLSQPSFFSTTNCGIPTKDIMEVIKYQDKYYIATSYYYPENKAYMVSYLSGWKNTRGGEHITTLCEFNNIKDK